jgi:hypothetical protein
MLKEKNKFFSVVALAVLVGVLFSGCPTGAPMSTTKLEIGGEMVSDVLGAWKEKWYKFEIDADNTPFLLIFKNLDAADESWLGYQINWYYKGDNGLVLLSAMEEEPTGPANPNNVVIFENKERIFYVAPYKGTYYIRLYGYAQPTSENKKYELRYVIGLAKPETYAGAYKYRGRNLARSNGQCRHTKCIQISGNPGKCFPVEDRRHTQYRYC